MNVRTWSESRNHDVTSMMSNCTVSGNDLRKPMGKSLAAWEGFGEHDFEHSEEHPSVRLML